MCGIVGAFAFGKPDVDKEKEKIRQEAIIFLTTELLQQTQTRGEDATGIATLFDNGMYVGLKAGVKAVNFISSRGGKETDYEGYLKIWRHKLDIKNNKYARIHIGHCRKSSVGNSRDNNNNHPIVVDPIIGIHNGTLKNHDLIFDKLACERTGTVDSEAIIRLVHHFSNAGKRPFTVEMMKEVGNRLEGSFATIIMNANNPYQVTIMRDMRPVEMLLIKPLNLVLIASETKFLDVILYRYNKYISLYNMGKNLPLLTKADLDDKMLPNDYIAIFDLTKEITKSTKITDLYEDDKLAFNSRIWKAPFKTVTNTSYGGRTSIYSGGYRMGITAGKTDKKNDKKDGDKLNTSAPAGRVWNKQLNAFTEAGTADTKSTDDRGSVTVDVDTGEVKESGLTKVKDADKELVVDTLTVNVEDVGDVDKDKKDEKETVIDTVLIKEVDMTVDPTALEEAEIASKAVKQYDDADEVASDLELSDSGVLKNIPSVSLANRIKRFIYKIAFYDGYCKATKDLEETSNKHAEYKNRRSLKSRKQEKNIRVLKAMTKFISGITDNIFETNGDSIRTAVHEQEVDKELTPDSVLNVLKTGDIRSSKTLKELVTRVQLENSLTTNKSQ